MRPSNDREAITLILEGLVNAGHVLTSVIEDTWQQESETPVSTVAEAVDLVTGVDEAFVRLNGRRSYVYFVLGNDPEEVACDYTTDLDPDLSNIVDPWWDR